MALGVALELAGLSKSIKGDPAGSNLTTGGAVVVLGGVVISMLSKKPTKRAVLRFNDLEMGRSSLSNRETVNPLDTKEDGALQENQQTGSQRATSKVRQPDSPGPRIAVHIGMNNSKFWEIGGSEELRTDEKIWWAKTTPIAISYEMPSSVPGQSLVIELAAIGKGERDKSESTTSSGTTKSKSDFQMTFAQLSAIKKIPIGTQNSHLRFHAEGGVFVGYAVNAKTQSRSRLKNDDTRRFTRQVTQRELGDGPGQLDFGRLDAGILIGAGASYPIGHGRLLFDMRFSVGALNQLNAESPDPVLKLPSLHTRDLAFMVGYSVPLSSIHR
jgi:hypothetical protein